MFKGLVIDANNQEPLVGATIYNKCHKAMSVTDAQGIFNIQAEINDTLIVRYLGYKAKDLICQENHPIRISMYPESTILDDAIVIAYGKQKKNKINGAITFVRNEDLETSVQDVSMLLQGKAVGLQSMTESGDPSISPMMYLRGVSSVHSYSAPLYVLNGLIVDPSLMSRIPTSNIASISILKDASATALYGSRGANGVILIETKESASDRIRVGATFSYGLIYPNTLPIKLMSSKEKLEYEVMLGIKRLSRDKIDQLSKDETNWENQILRDGTSKRLELSVEGGNGNDSYRHQISYYNELGTLQNSSLENYSYTCRLRNNLGDKVQSSFYIYGNHTKIKSPTGLEKKLVKNSPVIQAYLNNPYDPPMDKNGRYLPTSLGPNAIRDLNMITYETKDYQIRLQNDLKWSILDGFYFKVLYSWNYTHRLLDQFNPPGISIYPMNPATNVQGDKKRSYSGNTRLQTSNQLHYEYINSKRNHFQLMCAFETDYRKEDGFIALAKGFVNPMLSSLSSAEEPFQTAERYWERNMLSYLSFIKYDWNNTFFMDVSFRRDGSSVFGADNPYSNFYSVGVGCDLADILFKNNVKLLKLRASCGTSGNEGISPFQTMSLFKFNQYYGDKKAGDATQLGDNKLEWEKSITKNIGIDFESKNTKWGVNVDFYRQDVTNLLLEAQLSRLYGFSSTTANSGALRNQGLELSLHSTLLRRNNWSLSVETQYSYNKNIVTKTPNGDDIITGSVVTREGEPFGSLLLVPYSGVNVSNGAPLWLKKDGRLTEVFDHSDAVVLGTGIPPHNGSLRVNLRNRHFNFSILFTSATGNKVLNNSRYFLESDGEFMIYNQDRRLLTDAWKEIGDITDIPKQVANGNNHQMSSRYVEPGDYVRLKNIRLSYFIDKDSFIRSPFHTEFSIEAANLYTWTKYKGADPEMARAVDAFRYPSNKTIFLGVSMNF
jgi:TonB-linked SusC/RagA family outer membrane protein